MHFFLPLAVLGLGLLSVVSSATTFFNIEVLINGRSFNYFIEYNGVITRKARFSKEPDVFALNEDGQISGTYKAGGRLHPSPSSLVVKTQDEDEDLSKIWPDLLFTQPFTETFSIDDQGIIQWQNEAFKSPINPEGKAVWCSAENMLIARKEPVGDQCKGWSLKARMVDPGLPSGSSEL